MISFRFCIVWATVALASSTLHAQVLIRPVLTGSVTDVDVPVLDGVADLAFIAGNPSDGIYTRFDGTSRRIVGPGTPMPGSSESFRTFIFTPSLDDRTVAFTAEGTDDAGIYTVTGSSVSLVADTSTQIPGGSGTFTFFNSSPSIDGGQVAFLAKGPNGHSGIYARRAGCLERLADLGSTVPGTRETFTDLSTPGISSGRVVFRGEGPSRRGVYVEQSGQITRIADTATQIPARGGQQFTSFGSTPDISGPNVAFTGGNSAAGYSALIAAVGDELRVIADTDTPVPDGTGQFLGFGGVSIDGENVAFAGTDSSGRNITGIYAFYDEQLVRVIELDDTLEGQGIQRLNFSRREAFSGNIVAFRGTLADGTRRMYLATVPEPALLAWTSLLLAIISRRGSRRCGRWRGQRHDQPVIQPVSLMVTPDAN